jgi:hypothetical protein
MARRSRQPKIRMAVFSRLLAEHHRNFTRPEVVSLSHLGFHWALSALSDRRFMWRDFDEQYDRTAIDPGK